MEPLKLNPVVNQILEQLVPKFGLSLTTFARAVYMFHHILRERPHMQYQQLRYGTVCLYLAIKMTEGQADIPSISKFTRQACKVFERAEYLALEEEIFAYFYDKIFEVGFFTEYLDFYLTKGVVFSNERQAIPTDIENKIRETAYGYIQSGQFLTVSPQSLAAFILYQARQELKVTEIWTEAVESYTQVSTYEIYTIVKEMRRNASKNMPSKKIILKHSISSVSSSTVSFGSYSNSTLSRTNSLNMDSPPQIAVAATIV